MASLADLNKNMPILVVDDFSTVRRIVRNCLGRLGFKNVIEAEDQQKALELLKDNEVEFVISDWQIPGGTNDELFKAVRNEQPQKQVPILMIVPEAQKSQAEKNSKTKLAEFLVKPFTTEALQAKMEELLSKEF